MPGWAKQVLEQLMINGKIPNFFFEKASNDNCAFDFCHVCAFLLHRIPFKNDGIRRNWMEDKGTQKLNALIESLLNTFF